MWKKFTVQSIVNITVRHRVLLSLTSPPQIPDIPSDQCPPCLRLSWYPTEAHEDKASRTLWTCSAYKQQESTFTDANRALHAPLICTEKVVRPVIKLLLNGSGDHLYEAFRNPCARCWNRPIQNDAWSRFPVTEISAPNLPCVNIALKELLIISGCCDCVIKKHTISFKVGLDLQ